MQNITGLLYSGADTPAELFDSYHNGILPLSQFIKSEFTAKKIPDEKKRADMMNSFIHLVPYTDLLKNTSVYNFIEETSSDFHVYACRVGPEDCSKQWKSAHFQEGKCKVFNPMINVSTLNIVVGYEGDDWGPGWTNFMEGLSMFYTANYQKILNFRKSLQVTSKSIPIVKLVQQKKQMLGAPYSICRHQNEGRLKFLPENTTYTEKHCIFECKIQMAKLKISLLT
ncbi:Oidioi.mRNA.OKI2018_I69.chr2.g6489.t1.cds [Oikopleura dioica]|uniref:Oidioi.mRNA.OKI2018_I69.chr2.g6489.t1.cds n=1 Tax=Oikopleura dioica TaxID=34765 RepID=A0ABN7T803_OIKDI|nr:Oidioi.mRNA.OKI2018_I69.chr2.g6489.t1.cds [Oikopleura dioica]